MSKTMTGAQALIYALETQGVDIVFGVPGGAILPAYDPIRDSKIRHVLNRAPAIWHRVMPTPPGGSVS